MRIVSVVGTRPQLIKAAVLSPVLRRHHTEILIDTGQHYDDELAGSFFRELGLSRPDHALGVGGGSHALQTSEMVRRLEPILLDERPDRVVVYGDTNSTLSGALVAAKLGQPLAHVEAGLRSFDRTMPEEVNRLVADHLSDWLFAPTREAVANLAKEGISEGVRLVGDLMHDLAARVAPTVRDPSVLGAISQALDPGTGAARLERGRFLLATIHRAENRQPRVVREWAALLAAIARPDRPVVFPLHPGTRVVLERERVDMPPEVRLVPPQRYATTLALELHAAAVITDSGGVQREAGWLGTPCLVLRDRTEWSEQVAGSGGAMRLVGRDTDATSAALEELAPLDRAPNLARERAEGLRFGPSGAAQAIVAALATPGRP